MNFNHLSEHVYFKIYLCWFISWLYYVLAFEFFYVWIKSLNFLNFNHLCEQIILLFICAGLYHDCNVLAFEFSDVSILFLCLVSIIHVNRFILQFICAGLFHDCNLLPWDFPRYQYFLRMFGWKVWVSWISIIHMNMFILYFKK